MTTLITKDEIIDKDEVLKMARQAGFGDGIVEFIGVKTFQDFAKLAAEAEREACAEIAEKQRYAMNISLTSHPAQNGTAVQIANAIRARGQHDSNT